MKTKYYFEYKDSEICYTENKFQNDMKESGSKTIEVFKAIPFNSGDYFWCNHEGFCGDDSREHCGKQCKVYTPRNGKSGRCKYHSKTMYSHGKETILIIT